jgi:hypothetical protein
LKVAEDNFSLFPITPSIVRLTGRKYLVRLGVRGSSSHPHGLVHEALEVSFALTPSILDFGTSIVSWAKSRDDSQKLDRKGFGGWYMVGVQYEHFA